MLRILFNLILCQLRLERQLMFQGFALLSVEQQESVYQRIHHIVPYFSLVSLHIFPFAHTNLTNEQSEIDFLLVDVSSGAYSKINSFLCIFMIF